MTNYFKNLLRRKDIQLFFYLFTLALVSRWVIILVSYLINHFIFNGGTDFFSFIRIKFSEAGDSPHYLYLAENWYQASGDKANLIVFFPLYPILMKIVNFIVNDLFYSGMVVSQICFGISCYLLYKLTRLDYDDDTAKDSVLFLSLFPFGVFFFGIFTESLFILLTIAAIYMSRQKKHLYACIFGAMAAFSRMQGIIVLIPIVYEYICNNLRHTGKRPFSDILKSIKPDFLYTALIFTGSLGYLLLNKTLQNDWFVFLKHQAAPPWYNSTRWIGDNLNQHFDMGLSYGGLSLIIYFVQLFLFFFCVILLIYGLKNNVRTSYIAYGEAYIFATFLHGWMISGPRYVMCCAPIYIILASIPNKAVKNALIMLFGMFFVFYTTLFLQGQAIM